MRYDVVCALSKRAVKSSLILTAKHVYHAYCYGQSVVDVIRGSKTVRSTAKSQDRES
jgi:V8-like Glu-specific endopeptidase